ncbi:MAG: DNA-directed RNA polymerase subunit L [Candidatus Aenigmarchaeota archaeon]|nr:DNA-directed RNA polymerase subunit L [Candidatus Aenigmarchaeota archaeon]
MELRVVKEGEKTLILELKGETIGFVNLLREALWNDKNVSEAAYIKEHPYLSEPKIFVKTSRGLPKTALEKATDFIINKTKEFREEFKKALKK